MDIITNNLSELSAYIDDLILPFKNANSIDFANIYQFYIACKKSLVIIY